MATAEETAKAKAHRSARLERPSVLIRSRRRDPSAPEAPRDARGRVPRAVPRREETLRTRRRNPSSFLRFPLRDRAALSKARADRSLRRRLPVASRGRQIQEEEANGRDEARRRNGPRERRTRAQPRAFRSRPSTRLRRGVAVLFARTSRASTECKNQTRRWKRSDQPARSRRTRIHRATLPLSRHAWDPDRSWREAACSKRRRRSNAIFARRCEW